MNISEYCETNTSAAESILDESASSTNSNEDVCRDNALHGKAPEIDQAAIDAQTSGASAGSLVVHVRSGDIFSRGFKNGGFGQV